MLAVVAGRGRQVGRHQARAGRTSRRRWFHLRRRGNRGAFLDGDLSGDLSGGCRRPLSFAFWDEDFKLPLRVTPRRLAVQASIATLLEIERTGATLRSSCHAPTAARPVVRRPSAVAARVGSHFRAGSRQGGGLGIGVGGWHWRCQWHARTGSAVRRTDCQSVPRFRLSQWHACGVASRAVRVGRAFESGPVAGNRAGGPAAHRSLAGARRRIPRAAAARSAIGRRRRGRGDAAGPRAAGDRVGRVEHLGRFAAGGRRRAGGRLPLRLRAPSCSTATRTPAASAGGFRSG